MIFDEYLTYTEAAEILRVDERQIKALRDRDLLRVLVLGTKTHRIMRSELDRCMRAMLESQVVAEDAARSRAAEQDDGEDGYAEEVHHA